MIGQLRRDVIGRLSVPSCQSVPTLRPTLALLRQRLYRTSEAPLKTYITTLQYTCCRQTITTLRRLLTNVKDKDKPEADRQGASLRSADAFPVVASLPPKNSVCEPERLNDFRDVRTF